MKDGQLFRVKVIKSEKDLPVEFGKKHWGHTISGRMIETDIAWTWRVNEIDWYLEPIEITDSDIEAWAEKEIPFTSSSTLNVQRMRWIQGAKAALNGEIKHKEE